MEKSLECLFRSILHDVFQFRPDLFPLLITGNWCGSVLPHTVGPHPVPTFVQLRKAFHNLLRNCGSDFRLFLIIDGLDEYDSGDCASKMAYPDLAELFESVSDSNNVRILVSSRPLLVFEEAFAYAPQLKLQDLTHGDFRTYVDDTFKGHKRFLELCKANPYAAKRLASEITTKASGVFLWVRLVVKSLLEGPTDGNTLDELRRTLDDAPEALQDLFRLIFSKISRIYQPDAHYIFQIVRQFRNCTDDRALGAATLSFASEDTTALESETRLGVLTLEQSQERRLLLERRLKSRCCGLIEIHDKVKELVDDDGSTKTQKTTTPLDAEVQSLHKTVTDFLDDRATWDIVLAGPDKSFDPNISLMNSYIMQLKHLKDFRQISPREGSMHDKTLWQLMNNIALFAREAKEIPTQLKLLHEMDRTVSLYWARGGYKGISWSDSDRILHHPSRSCECHGSFLSFCIQNGSRSYVAAEFSKYGNKLINKEGRPLLDYAVSPESAYLSNYVNPAIVEILLNNGADLNKYFDGESVWSNALWSLHSHFQYREHEKLFQILELLVFHGADRNAVIPSGGDFVRRYSALRILRLSPDWVGEDELIYPEPSQPRRTAHRIKNTLRRI